MLGNPRLLLRGQQPGCLGPPLGARLLPTLRHPRTGEQLQCSGHRSPPRVSTTAQPAFPKPPSALPNRPQGGQRSRLAADHSGRPCCCR
jgi:hypothetical protein